MLPADNIVPLSAKMDHSVIEQKGTSAKELVPFLMVNSPGPTPVSCKNNRLAMLAKQRVDGV